MKDYKIAICVCGEFRNKYKGAVIDQLKNLKAFLMGLEHVDIYIRSWDSKDKEEIIRVSAPKAYSFDQRINFEKLESKIRYKESNIVKGRDIGTLSMFYTIEQCYKLITDPTRYDFIIRTRPDLFYQKSLKELLEEIDRQTIEHNDIYLPKRAHAMGINDQFAIGTPAIMEKYFTAFSYIKKNINLIFFNPEYMVLRNLLVHGAQIKLIDFSYTLMRFFRHKIETIYQLDDTLLRDWWSYDNKLPILTNINEFFREKELSTEFRWKVSRGKPFHFDMGQCIVQVNYFDKSTNAYLLFIEQDKSSILPKVHYIENPIVPTGIPWNPPKISYNFPSKGNCQDYVFVYAENDQVIISIYNYSDTLYNKKIYTTLDALKWKTYHSSRFGAGFLSILLGSVCHKDSQLLRHAFTINIKTFLSHSHIKSFYTGFLVRVPLIKMLREFLRSRLGL